MPRVIGEAVGDASAVIRRAVVEDAEAVAEIYNQGIAERSATFETEPRTAADRRAVIAAQDQGYPVLVAEVDGRVAGWASLSSYRSRACYRGVAEFSVYVERGARERGLGRRLVAGLIDEARALGFWKIVSRIFTENTKSRELCRSLGFREVGIYERHAQLDGRWLDVVVVERLLPENQR